MDNTDMNLVSGIAAFEVGEFRHSLQLLQPLASRLTLLAHQTTPWFEREIPEPLAFH